MRLPDKDYKSLFIVLLKWLPAIGTAAIVAHYAHILAGGRTVVIDYLADTSLFAWVFLYLASRLFFCHTHQMLIWYIGIASLEVDLRRWTHFATEPRWIIPVIMIVAGLFLLFLAYKRKIHYRGR